MSLTLAINKRSSWGGSVTSPSGYANLQQGIIVHWNGPAMGAYSADAVPSMVYNTWRYHVQSNGWADIAYNFSIDRFGRVWEGRGENVRNAASGDSYANSNYTAVELLIGEGDTLTQQMLDGLAAFRKNYIENGGSPLITLHRAVTATSCPGDQISAYVTQMRQTTSQVTPPGNIPFTPTEESETNLMPDFFLEGPNGSIFGFYTNGYVRPVAWSEVVVINEVMKKGLPIGKIPQEEVDLLKVVGALR